MLYSLKNDYELIISYCNDKTENYWTEIASFRDIDDTYTCWTSNKKLSSIL